MKTFLTSTGVGVNVHNGAIIAARYIDNNANVEIQFSEAISRDIMREVAFLFAGVLYSDNTVVLTRKQAVAVLRRSSTYKRNTSK